MPWSSINICIPCLPSKATTALPFHLIEYREKGSTEIASYRLKFATMACNNIAAAATCVVLVLSFILPSGNIRLITSFSLLLPPTCDFSKNKSPFGWADVQAVSWPPCNPFVRSRLGLCGGERQHCKDRCQLEGYSGGICDSKDICYCLQTNCSSDGKLNGGQRR